MVTRGRRSPCSLWMEWSWTGVGSCSRRCTSGTSWRWARRPPSCTPSTINPATCTGSPGSRRPTSGWNVLVEKKKYNLKEEKDDQGPSRRNAGGSTRGRFCRKAHRWCARRADTGSASRPSAPPGSWNTRCPQGKLPLTCETGKPSGPQLSTV